ncbi:MAG TPA: hypothetical protein VJH37_04740 [Candidatus Nanoarchaeia archaeon]|nr:hypothetical protein [Candidatus Nanoarchaeia archaeon]
MAFGTKTNEQKTAGIVGKRNASELRERRKRKPDFVRNMGPTKK